MEGELDSLRDRYSSTNEELAIINEDRVRLTEHVDQLKQQLQKSNDDKNVAQRASMKQVWLSFLTGFEREPKIWLVQGTCKRLEDKDDLRTRDGR